ncbi:MFS transporter [Streptomyces olivoreticuli]|uniref:MFS transporter n=1 Tax=Streptomyces olivoreticuli TaxID=68246 RepID=UPI002658A219|nr:MFS transporter [Streptomyces olivoreticuli]WKK23964.1 MFS transporter [Streptomyces olivoreticuli]
MSRPIRSGRASVDIPSTASPRLGLVLMVIAAAQLMVVLDSTIVNIALPEIQHGLAFSSTGLQWVVTAYALAFGGLLLLGGRAGDMFGHRRTFLVGIALFSTASLLGGLAAAPSWLVASRALQGAGAAMASPAALALIASTFPEGGPRNRAMGVYAGMGSSGGAIGLLLGGLLTEYASWRWVMFVNVPIGALVLLVAARTVPKTAVRGGQLDLPGAITASSGLALLVYGLSNVSAHGWGATFTHGPLIAAAILLAGFLLIERVASQPLVPLHLFHDRNRSSAYAIMLAIGAVMFAMFFFTTQYEQNVLGYSPLRAGVAFLPLTVVLVVVATVVSRVLGDRTGIRLAVTTGPLVITAGLFWATTVSTHSSYLDLLGPFVTTSAGVGMSFVPLTLIAMATVRPEDRGIASALLNASQQIGGSFGLTVLVTVAGNAARDWERRAGTARMPAAGLARGAFTQGYHEAFLTAGFITLAAFLIATATIRTRPEPAGDVIAAVPDPG